MAHEPLPQKMVIAYAAPYMGLAFFQMSFTNYFYKYAVDVLLIGPAVVAAILSLTRLWDAVSDPLAGHLSDRTSTRAGRRRPWLLGSTIPVALTTFMMWNPPASLDPQMLVIWIAVAVTLWETAMTTFYVPYMALGAEVSMNHHDRTRVAGYRHVLGAVGQLSVIGGVYLITHSETPRDTTFELFSVGAVVAALLMFAGIWRVRERAEHRDLGSRSFLRSVRNALRNRHLLRLVAIYFFDIAGVASIGLLGPFVAEYVVGQKGLVPWLMLVSLLASYVSTPFTVALSSRFGKRQVWMLVLTLQTLGFALTFLAGEGDALYLLGCAALIGLGATGGHVVGMSLLADAADYDELATGERREGLYYSAINIARKVMFSAMTAVVGPVMHFGLGFRPNEVQTPETLLGLSALFAGMPVAAFLTAIFLLRAYGLTEQEHARIRTELDARPAPRS